MASRAAWSWEHGCNRWRGLPEAALLVMLTAVVAPSILAVAEFVAAAGLMLLGLLMLFGWRLGRRRHPFAAGLVVGGLVGWLLGRRRRRGQDKRPVFGTYALPSGGSAEERSGAVH